MSVVRVALTFQKGPVHCWGSLNFSERAPAWHYNAVWRLEMQFGTVDVLQRLPIEGDMSQRSQRFSRSLPLHFSRLRHMHQVGDTPVAASYMRQRLPIAGDMLQRLPIAGDMSQSWSL